MAKPTTALGLSREDLIEAVRDGVSNAIWTIATSATNMPGTDLYAAIENGVERAMVQVAKEEKR